MKTMHTLAVALLAVGAVACSNSEEKRAEEIRTMPNEAALTSLQTRLHTEGLLTVPEVRTKSDSFVQAYRDNRMTRDSASKEFLIWLENWVVANPDDVAAARERAAARAPAPAPQP